MRILSSTNNYRMGYIVTLLLALVIGFGGGYLVADDRGEVHPHEDEATTHETSMKDDQHMHAEVLELTNEEALPSVVLAVTKDPTLGWNAKVTLENFIFSPENVSTEHVLGEGHAHIYVNDTKINRIYGDWYHLSDLTTGDEVSVRLSTNDHREIAYQGEVIADRVIIEDFDHDHAHGDDDHHHEEEE